MSFIVDRSHMSANEAFVAVLFDNSAVASPITVASAACDLAILRDCGYAVPVDMTPVEFTDIWNRFSDAAGHILDCDGRPTSFDDAAAQMDAELLQALREELGPYYSNQALYNEYHSRYDEDGQK